jgi:hypothetical protein
MHSFFLARYHYLILILFIFIVLGLFLGHFYEVILLSAFIAIEIYRRNLTQLDKIKESFVFSFFFQTARLVTIVVFKPENMPDLYSMLTYSSIPFIVFIFFSIVRTKAVNHKFILSKDDMYISLTSAIGTMQFYLPVFTSSLFFSKEMAAAIIAVRFFANITNVFAEIIEYGFKEFFKFLKAKFNTNAVLLIIFFTLISSIIMYIGTKFFLPIFFPKTVIFNQVVNFSVIAVIFWVGQILHIAQRIISYSFNFNGDFKITLIAQTFSLILTLVYFIALFYSSIEELFYIWAFCYIFIPFITLAFLFLILKRRKYNEKNISHN